MLAVALPTASPTPEPIKTIVTVVSSPYCRSLAEHFDDALVPMLANDRTLDAAGVSLDSINTLFKQPDYVQRFVQTRENLGREETVLNTSLAAIQQQINELRGGSTLTTDPQAAAAVHQAAQELQTAYDKQRQLAIDLQGTYQAMLDYPITRVNPALGGFDPQEMSEPTAMQNVKTYLRFDGQRDVIARSEGKAVDVAYAAAQTYCTPKTSPSPSASP